MTVQNRDGGPAMTPTSLIDAIHDHRTLCDQISWRLRDLAASFADVGNDKIADELSAIAAQLPPSAREISEAHSLELSGHLRDAENMAGLLLKATLEGAIGPARSRP